MSTEEVDRFKEFFLNKAFCPSVSVDLAKLRDNHNIDLFPWLKAYESFISIKATYTPNIVKIFYFNMVTDNILDSENNLVEERITTTVKGVQFTISASIINKILQIVNPPPIPEITLSNREIFSLLCPNKPFPANQSHTLSFKPSEMPNINRILWYIYSRNFIQKGGNFSHFTQRDYKVFASFVKQTPFNLGHLIFQEMLKCRFSSRRPSHIPFPSLVSVILFYHKVWYVGPPDSVKTPATFGKNQLNYMKITVEGEGSGQSRAPTQSQARASQSHAQEAQSGPSQPNVPSDFESRVKGIVDRAIAQLSIRIEYEIGKLVAEVQTGNNDSVDAQEALKLQIADLKDQSATSHRDLTDQIHDLDARLSSQLISNVSLGDKVEKILTHLGIGSSTAFGSEGGPSSSHPKPDSDPSSSSPSFTFDQDPIPSTSPNPSTPVLSSPVSSSSPHTEVLGIPSPSTPTTEIFNPSLTPSTEILPHNSPPSTPIFNPYTESSTSAPPSFEDDKGGEKED